MGKGSSRFKGICERAVEGMAKSFFIKAEEAFARDPQMIAPFFARIYSRSFQLAAVDQVADRTSGDGEELGDIANFDQGRNGIFFESGTNCNHGVEFLGV